MVICPFCGFEFERTDTLCRHGCPLSAMCNLTRCPSCEYEFPTRPEKPSWWRSLFAGRSRPTPLPERALTVRDLDEGARVRVLGLACASAGRRNHLTVFGLTPGTEVELLQRRPAFVLRVGETDLALDPEIAAEVVVEPVGEPPGPLPRRTAAGAA
ncbi:MAG TPA: FeoA family protein [Thermoanaerobaculia bacterium]|nr:FeoA family protein [Thermoanaerobaculia bacterium]